MREVLEFRYGKYEVEKANKGMIYINGELHKCNLNESLHKGCKDCIYSDTFIYCPETRQCEFKPGHVFRKRD